MYLCDTCGASLVNSGKIAPLSQIWGANQIPWKNCECGECGNKEDCMQYPERYIKENGQGDQ